MAGAGDLIINNNTSLAGGVAVTTANNSGAITNSGTGTGAVTITTVGTNVTSVTESSATSALTLSTLNVNTGGTTLTNSSSAKVLTVTNQVVGTGNLALNNNNATAAGIVLTGGVNNSGTVVNSGTGTGSVTLNAIGSNVTGVTQNSNTSVATASNLAVNSSGTTLTSGGSALLNFTGNATGTGNLSFVENASGGITIVGVNNAGTVTNSGTGTGTTTIGGVIGTFVTGVTQNSATSTLILSGANTFTGGLNIQRGTVVANVSNATTVSGAAGPSTSAITLGSSSGGSASLLANSFTVSNAINLGTSSVGTLTIGNNGGATAAVFSGALGLNGNNLTVAPTGTGSVSLSGGTSGSGNLALINDNAATIGLITNAVNNTGTITHTGIGTGGATISGVIGTNVLGVTQNSATSTLTLGGTNTFTSGLSILNGSVITTSAAPIGTGAVSLGGGGTASFLAFTASLGNTFNIGSSSGTLTIANTGGGASSLGLTGTLALGANAVTLASTGTGTLTQSGSVTGSGTLNLNAATGTSITLTGTNTAFSGNTNISGSGTVSLSSATVLGGNGSTTGTGGSLSIAAGSVIDSSGTTFTTVNAENWNGSFTFTGSGNLNLGTGSINATTPLTLTVNANILTAAGTFSNTNGVFAVTKAGTGTFVNSGNISLAANQTANILAGTETLSGIISGGFGITATGGGTMILSGSNSFTGPMQITGGTSLTANTLANGGSNSNIGAGSAVASNLVIDNGTLNTSFSGSTNRLFTIGAGGATINSTGNLAFSGTGALAYTGTGARSLTLGTGNFSTFAPVIADGTGGATTLIKNSTGRWALTDIANNTYSGGTLVQSGSLASTTTAQSFGTGNVTVSGGAEVQLKALSNLGTGAKINLNGDITSYATAAFGYNVTDADLVNTISSTSTNGVISLFADGGQTVSNNLVMSNYGDGLMYLGAGGFNNNGTAQTITYSGTSLGVNSDNVYRLGGGINTSANTFVIANNILTAGTSLVIGAPGSNNIVQFNSNQSAFNGTTTINNGTLVFSGTTAALGSSVIRVNNTPGSAVATKLTLSDGTGAPGSVTRAAGVILDGGAALAVTGNATSNSVDNIAGALAIGSNTAGSATVTITPNAAKNAQLTAGSLTRSSGSTVLFRGTGLGTTSIASATANTSNISFGTAPTLVGGGGAAGTPTVSILVGAFGDTTAAGTGLGTTGGLVTYDATNGVRLLSGSEYSTTLANGLDNVRLTNSTGSAVTYNLVSNTTVNSLSLMTTALLSPLTINGPGVLTINSGVIYAVNTTANTTAQPMTISADINLNGQEGIVLESNAGSGNGIGGSNLNLSGSIGNDGGKGLTINASGGSVVEMSGSTANTYTGLTTVNSGNLALHKSVAGGNGTILGNLLINGGRVQMQSSNQIADSSDVTITGGTWDLRPASNSGSGSPETIHNLAMSGGTIIIGGSPSSNATLTLTDANLSGGVIAVSASNKMVVNGLLSFAPGATTVNTLTASTSTSSSAYSTLISANMGVAISNSAAGAYVPLILNAGSSVGTLGGRINLSNGLTFTGNSSNANTVSINTSNALGATGVMGLATSNVVFNIGDGAAATDLAINVPLIEGTSPTTTFSVAVTKDGAGTLLLTAASNWSNGTTINAGTLKLSGAATLGAVGALSQAGLTMTGGTLDLGGTTQVIDTLSVTGASTIQNGTLKADDAFGSQTFAFGNNSGTVTVSANLSDAANIANPTPAVPLVMSGTGVVDLSGVNTYTGGTTVSAGTLKVNNTSGSATGTGAVAIQTGATLGGGSGAANSGTLVTLGTLANIPTLQTYMAGQKGLITGPVTVQSGATLAPGNSVGTITMASLTLDAGSILNYEFNGTANDFTSISNTLTINGGSFNLYQEGTTTAFTVAGTYDLFSYGTLTGSVASLSVANMQAGYTYTFVNDNLDGLVQLQIAVVPEPGTWAMMIGGLVVLVAIQRRRNKLG